MKATARQNIFALMLITGVLMAFGVRLWATHQLSTLAGPGHVAATNDTLYVQFNDSLYRIDTVEERMSAVPLSILGVNGPVAGMQALSDAGLLIGDLERGVIRRCSLTTRRCRDIARQRRVLSNVNSSSLLTRSVGNSTLQIRDGIGYSVNVSTVERCTC